jgi:hypothetical protein
MSLRKRMETVDGFTSRWNLELDSENKYDSESLIDSSLAVLLAQMPLKYTNRKLGIQIVYF